MYCVWGRRGFFLRVDGGGAIVAGMAKIDKAALVLEGGGMRGVFTAGVLDEFLRRGLAFNYAIGTSAGASNGLSYASRQAGRARYCNIDALRKRNYIGAKFLLTQRCIMDFDYLFGELPLREYPFDFDRYLESGRFILTATDCRSGQARYFDTPKTPAALLAACRASCSMPLVCPMCRIGGREYLDGGIVDAIPFKKAIADGREKIVAVLTRKAGYRKVENWKYISLIYYNYPNLRRALMQKAQRYNDDMAELEGLERAGRAVVLRPTYAFASRLTSDKTELERLYFNGVRQAQKHFEKIEKFLAD